MSVSKPLAAATPQGIYVAKNSPMNFLPDSRLNFSRRKSGIEIKFGSELIFVAGRNGRFAFIVHQKLVDNHRPR